MAKVRGARRELFVMSNYFCQGWIVSRLQNSVRAAFGSDAPAGARG